MDTLQVIVRGRNGLVHQGAAWAVSGVNAVGPFDVLMRHANFVSTVTGPVVIRMSGKEQEIPFERGVLRVFNNVIELYIGV